MKKALMLVLICAFLVSVAGCVAKTEYDKLADEKASLETKCNQLTAREAQLKSEISAAQNEINNLRAELTSVRARIEELEKPAAGE